MKRLKGMPRRELLQELFADLQTIRRKMGKPAGHDAKDGDITGSQWAVLHLLFHRESMTVKDAAQTLAISSSAATQLIDPLVKKGYLTRTEGREDRRVVDLRLSKKASQQIDRMRNEYFSRLADIFEVLSDAEIAQYVSLTKKLLATKKNQNLTK